MRGNVSQGSSGASKRGAGASLGKKITAKAKVKPSPSTQSSSSTSDSQDTGASKQQQEVNKYNKALEKYHNEDKDLAFMKEENFGNFNEDGSEMSITERNIAMLSADSLASRIASATGRYDPNQSRFGAGRSRLPGDDPITGQGPELPNQLPRFALTRSQLYRGINPNEDAQNNPLAGTTFTTRGGTGASAVSNNLNGNSSNSTVNFEAYTSAYLKANASHLSSKFESDPNFKQDYLNNVEKLYNTLDVRTLGNAPVEERRSKLVGQAGLSTSRDRQQVANAFMTLLANSDSQIDKISKQGLTVFLADSIVSQGENVAGYFSTDNHMVLSRDPGFASFNATAVHELTHVVDFNDGSLDGHISGLSSNWSNLRSDAEQKIAAAGGRLPGIDSGFANYSQTNDMEFLAVMSQLYQSDTQDMQRNFPQIFSALDRMFRVA